MMILSLFYLFAMLMFQQGRCSHELAQGKSAESKTSHKTEWSPKKAVDGDINTNINCNSCLHTGKDATAYLIVNLQEMMSIHRFEIYFVRTNSHCSNPTNDSGIFDLMKDRSRHYYVIISDNGTIEGKPCYKDNSTRNEFDLIQNQICRGTGRYISLVQKEKSENDGNPLLLVCEFKVYGCPIGMYGKNCNLSCHQNCQSCDPESGQCWKCNPGWRGENCMEDCPNGTYGDNCSEECGTCINNVPCNKQNGACRSCDRGVRGTFCKTVCSDGMYGYNCNETCGVCRGRAVCDKKYGNCTTDGCERGYKFPLCKDQCEDGYYGFNCNETCGHCRSESACDRLMGACPSELCDPGFTGSLCKDVCPNGTYGLNCDERCGKCRDQAACEPSSGKCPEGYCERGYEGYLCKTGCLNRTYGYNCLETCGFCRYEKPCNTTDGICPNSECEDGYNDTYCMSECPDGTYGYKCEGKCGHCLNGKPCHFSDGKCMGCERGYTGERCDEECVNGTYGINCLETCGSCLEKAPCDKESGTCPSGCESGFIGDQCRVRKDDLSIPDSDGPAASIIGGSSAAVLSVLVATIVTVVIYRRRHENNRQRKYEQRRGNVNRGEIETSFNNTQSKIRKAEYANVAGSKSEDDDEEEEPNDGEYVNCTMVSKDVRSYTIPIENLQKVIKQKEADDNKLFKEEFFVLPKGPRKSCSAAKSPENRSKNRFKTTFPYDETRVILHDGASDYINANYITDLTGRKAYIASQGPKDHTIIDMWRMVWQENITIIVMLTNPTEKQVTKCSKYWPSGQVSSRYDNFTISNLEEKCLRNFTMRTLQVRNTKTKTSRLVRHYHFTAWADHGVPESFDLIQFYERVKRDASNEDPESPLLVHCSAGIGRTGTFIALDALLEHSKMNKTINAFKYILDMRENDRMNMIQTVDQYIAIHHLLREAKRAKFYPISKGNLHDEVVKMCDTKTPANQSAIRLRLSELNTLKQMYTDDDYRGGLNHPELNVDANILPLDRYRLFLSSYVKGRSDYINAVTIPSQRQLNTFIVTNFPAIENSVDALRLLVDHGAALVVLGHEYSENKRWLPSFSETIDCEPFVVERSDLRYQQEHFFEESDLTVTNKKDVTSHSVRVFTVTKWPVDVDKTSELNVVADMIQRIMEWMETNHDGQIVVMSRDGVQCCDVFCATYNGIEQLQLEDELDMFNIVRQLQIRRPQFFPTVEEYKLCLRICACQTTATESIYANT